MFFFFNDTATTEIYTLSLHDALPICTRDRGESLLRQGEREAPSFPRRFFHGRRLRRRPQRVWRSRTSFAGDLPGDRKSTRLNSSHANISYAVFCLKKKKNHIILVISN